MVLSEGKSRPDLWSSHLIAETLNWANGSISKRFLVAIIASLSSLFICVDFCFGALDRSLNQSRPPVWYRLSHLKNHFFERPRLLYIDLGLSSFKYRCIADWRKFSSFIYSLLPVLFEEGILYYKRDKGNLCHDISHLLDRVRIL